MNSIKTETVSILVNSPTENSSQEYWNKEMRMSAYLARPNDSNQYPSVIVGMEIFGVNFHIKEITNQVARLGYVAIAPDFYHRTEPGIELAFDQTDRIRGMELMRQLKRTEVLKDIREYDLLSKK